MSWKTIPQGWVLGPDLFLIFINDTVQRVSGGSWDIFADDFIVYISGSNLAEIERRSQTSIDDINNWYYENRLKINVLKTNVMLISTRNSKQRGGIQVILDGNLTTST